MTDFDINPILQLVIFLPEISDVRYTAACKYRLLDVVEMKQAALQDLDSSLRIEQMRTQSERAL